MREQEERPSTVLIQPVIYDRKKIFNKLKMITRFLKNEKIMKVLRKNTKKFHEKNFNLIYKF